MLPKEQAEAAGKPYRLAVNEPLYVPVNKTIRMIITGADVIHSWTVPAFGVKRDAIPGRLNETYFHPERTGVFYGQCSELCGADHAFMPIEVHVVTQEEYDQWADAMKKKYASIAPSSDVATAEVGSR